MGIWALCETNLDDSFHIGQFDVPGYNCIRRDRSRNGGGLMYYIRSDIEHRRWDDLEHVIDSRKGFELIITELTLNGYTHWVMNPRNKELRFRERIEISISRNTERKLLHWFVWRL